MTREQARVVADLMLRHGKELNALLLQLQAMGLSGEEFDEVRRHVGSLMGSMLLDVMNPLFAAHPDLKPPELH
jgi:hypothetical protein